jgi:hypothetical protein
LRCIVVLTADVRPALAVTTLVVTSNLMNVGAPATLPSLHYPTKGLLSPQIVLSAISVEEKKVLLEITGMEQAEAAFVPELLLDISMKPLMMVVWTGVVLIIAGTALAFQRRLTEKSV